MPEIRNEIDIHAPAETVFAAIVDLRGYPRWLPESKAFPGTTEISSEPMVVGTTYVESGPSGVRRGTITELEPPTRVGFHQPMTMKPRLLGVIDIRVAYTLTPTADGVHVLRVVTIKLPAAAKVLQPIIMREFRTEIDRTMKALKVFAEGG